MNRGMPTIAVWFSCGAASAVAAKMTIDKYGKDYRVFVVNNPIKEEDGDNVRFKKDVGQWIGQPIIEAVNPDFRMHLYVRSLIVRNICLVSAGRHVL